MTLSTPAQDALSDDRQFTYRDILGFLNDQQYYTDDDGHIAIDAVKTARELDAMLATELAAARERGRREFANEIKHQFSLDSRGRHEIQIGNGIHVVDDELTVHERIDKVVAQLSTSKEEHE